MTTLDYRSLPPALVLRPTWRAVLLAFLVHHNPFYLLSALCMIAGCFALNSALELRSGEVGRLLILVGTINLYELLLIALGLYLVRSRGLLRDGRTLLLLQTVFLVDLCFINAEVPTASLRAGLLVGGALWGLALVKAAAVLLGLSGRRFPWRLFGFVAMQLTALFAVPVAFKWLDRDAAIVAWHFYAVWWCVGLLPALGALMLMPTPGPNADESPATAAPPVGPRLRIGGVYVGMTFCSLLAHMGMMHWVYRVPFSSADASPVLLGLAVALKGAKPAAAWLAAAGLPLLRPLLPAAAVVLSAIASPAGLSFFAGRGHRLLVTPMLLAAAGAYLVYVYFYLLPRAVYFVGAAAAVVLALLFGPTPTQVAAGTGSAWHWVAAWAVRLMPKTAMQWGIAAVASAFAFLGLGAAVSLSQGKAPKT